MGITRNQNETYFTLKYGSVSDALPHIFEMSISDSRVLAKLVMDRTPETTEADKQFKANRRRMLIAHNLLDESWPN